MKKKWLVLILLVLTLGIGLGWWGGWLARKQLKQQTVSGEASVETTPTPTSTPVCTLYTNEEYEFSLCYPTGWDLPEENKVTPPQQHLYQITLDPGGEGYLVDIYDQPSPISLGSFVRGYFKNGEAEVSWTNETQVNGQEALQFFIPKMGVRPMGIGATAFRKEGLILAISTSVKQVPGGDSKQLVNEETLTHLAESFEWLE